MFEMWWAALQRKRREALCLLFSSRFVSPLVFQRPASQTHYFTHLFFFFFASVMPDSILQTNNSVLPGRRSRFKKQSIVFSPVVVQSPFCQSPKWSSCSSLSGRVLRQPSDDNHDVMPNFCHILVCNLTSMVLAEVFDPCIPKQWISKVCCQ